MDDLTRNTCALLNEAGERLARGRYEVSADGTGAKFTPASIITPEQMALTAFLWPDDDQNRLPVADARPDADGHHFHLTLRSDA